MIPEELLRRPIVVCGGTGMVGAAVVRRLLAMLPQIAIRVVHRSNTGLFVRHPQVEYCRADLRNAADCRRACEGAGLAVASAAVTGGAAAQTTAPWLQFTDNGVLALQLLQSFHDAGVRRFAFLSSATVYQAAAGPLAEDDLDLNLDPPDAYLGVGWAMRLAEKACLFWHRKGGLEAVVCRLSNVFGPGAKFDPATSNVIPALIRKAVGRDDPFVVWGAPDTLRDVIYADDAADAVISLLLEGGGFQAVNVGTGEPVSVGRLVTEILASAGHTPRRQEWRSDGPTTIAARYLDISRLAATGFRPAVGLFDGIARTVAWWRENKETWSR
jgi:GDP-L-fucose synthase